MRILILGGTGVISRCIVHELLLKNHEIFIFHRGNTKLNFQGEVREIVGDRKDSIKFKDMMKNFKFDVVIDMICFTKEDAQLTIDTFKDQVEQIIITSSVAAYKRPLRTVPAVEEQEELTDSPLFGYGFLKAEIERYLNDLVENRRIPITIIRPSLTFGIGAINLGVLRQNHGIVDRIRKGKPLVMFGDGTTPFTFTFAADLAKAYAGAVGNKRTYAKSYHVANEERHIWDDLYLEFGKILGIEPKIIHIPTDVLYKFSPELFGHIYYEKKYAGLYDITKIKQDIEGLDLNISLYDGVKLMIDQYEKEAKEIDADKDKLEDDLIEIYNQWTLLI